MTEEKNSLFSDVSQFFKAEQILCKQHHEMEWGVMTEAQAEELCGINYMTRDLKNKSESGMAPLVVDRCWMCLFITFVFCYYDYDYYYL